ncbi:CDP-alcohol phosphatidyltransferase [Methanobrevibacter cuticularis]|uniref:CDP-alcohol phosphatidyltransferase n=1 Tax=Methanobrevibacter cuticularis TaxID=47311 RepID=A0A166DE50_9EURY|nr:archaetidylserine synthase [Methanobrevibacter cuticularis]KZX15498.1 CDP-alcohol phosphatidyltransferase [Methanobrevibacter cuticularis]
MKLKETKIECFLALPDIISLLNLSFGFLAILMALNNQITISSIFIIIAVIFDSVDGWIARKLSRIDKYGFGKNIDSLSDIVSFGVAPAVLLYIIGASFSNEIGYLSAVIALFVVICGVLRLTRFNVISDKIDFKGFVGVPIPTTGILLSTFILSRLFNIYLGMFLMVVVGFLMISNIKYKKFYNPQILPIIAILVLLAIIPNSMIFWGINIPATIIFIITLVYVFITPMLNLFKN